MARVRRLPGLGEAIFNSKAVTRFAADNLCLSEGGKMLVLYQCVAVWLLQGCPQVKE